MNAASGSAIGARTMLDAVAFTSIFVFGIVMALLGAVMPVLSAQLSLGLDAVGMLFLVTNASMLAASLVVGPVMDRAGLQAPLAVGAALVAIALLLIARATALADVVAGVAALGFGGGALNAGANTLVADLHEDPARKAAALNLLGVFFGFGALVLPLSIGVLLSSVGLAALLVAGAALSAATAIAVLTLTFPAPKQARGFPLADMGRFLGVPLVLTFAFLLFFQSGNEFLLGGYFTTFLTRDLAMPIEHASYVLAGYWAAIMASRVLLSGFVLRFGASRVVTGGALLASCGALVVAAAPSPAVAVAGVVLIGFALAGIFPTVLGLAGAAFRDHSGTVFGILFTIALTGGMTMPWVAGHLAEAAGLRVVFVLAAVNFVAVALLNGMSGRTGRSAG